MSSGSVFQHTTWIPSGTGTRFISSRRSAFRHSTWITSGTRYISSRSAFRYSTWIPSGTRFICSRRSTFRHSTWIPSGTGIRTEGKGFFKIKNLEVFYMIQQILRCCGFLWSGSGPRRAKITHKNRKFHVF
jgi:hypothetical protein